MTSTTQSIDWAPYKAKASDFESLEGWMYRVACYVSGVGLEQARAIAEILLTLPLETRCVWHAVWVYHGKQGKCDCAPCSRGGDAMTIPAVNHEGVEEAVSMWQYRRYLDAVRTFMKLRAEMGERPSQTLGVRNGAWAHHLLDRLIENADDLEQCKQQTKRLEESILRMRTDG